MSIWSKLGLADAASLAVLKEEIYSLRQENEKLHEAQSKHTQQLYDSCTDRMEDTAVGVERKVSGLEEQLKALQSELESNLRDSQKEILSAGNSHRDHVMHQVSIILENQKLFKEYISSITASRERAFAQIMELLNEMRSLQDRTSGNLQTQYSELSSVCHVISDGLVSLKENAQAQNGIVEKMVDQLDSGQIELQKILNETQSVAEDISFLKKYTESLWEAMKLVWINDLLNDAKK